MTELVGADPDSLEQAARGFDMTSEQMADIGPALHGRFVSSPWTGGAADRFRSEWAYSHRPALRQAADILRRLAAELRRQAEEQRRASSDPGGSSRRLGGSRGHRRLDGLTVVRSEDIEDRKRYLRAQIERLRDDSLVRRFGDFVADLHPGITSQLEDYEAELRTLEGLGDVSGRTFLTLDAKPGAHRLIEVYPDLDELDGADRVIIHIPGMTTKIDSYGKDGHGDARSLEQAANGGTERVAVISFMDYDVPQGLDSAASDRGARSGVDPLRSLVFDLRGIGFDRSEISVVAHSYGSVVTGHAMRAGLDVGRVVVVGSPGMGADNRSALGSPHVMLHAATSPADGGGALRGALRGSMFGLGGAAVGGAVGSGIDAVSHAPAHGRNPADGGFGAEVFDVPGARGHSGYFTGGSRSLRRIVELTK